MLPFKHGESEYTFRNLNIISTTMHSRGLHPLQLSLVLTKGDVRVHCRRKCLG